MVSSCSVKIKYKTFKNIDWMVATEHEAKNKIKYSVNSYRK